VALVEKMMTLKADLPHLEDKLDERRHEGEEEITRMDVAIDQAVYALYGLTEDEIALIEA
jgi:hypothetical protein